MEDKCVQGLSGFQYFIQVKGLTNLKCRVPDAKLKLWLDELPYSKVNGK